MENLKYIKDILALEKVIAGLKSASDEELKRIVFLKSQQSKKLDILNELKESTTKTKSSMLNAEKELFDVEKKLENAKLQLTSATSQSMITNLEDNIKTLEESYLSLEDDIILQLENIEGFEHQISELNEFISGVAETINEVNVEVDLINKCNEEKIQKMDMQIAGLLSEVPDNVANLYQKAKLKHSSDPATFLIGTSCGSCKFTYAPAECDNFNKGIDMILCRGCGRLLLPSNLRTL